MMTTEVSSIRSGLDSQASIWERDWRTATGHIRPVKSAAAAAWARTDHHLCQDCFSTKLKQTSTMSITTRLYIGASG